MVPTLARRGAVAIALVALVGCGSPPRPTTSAIVGKITYKAKGEKVRPLVGGKVRLESVADPAVIVQGEIEEDGTFTLTTYRAGQSYPGVAPGEYRGRVEPPGYADEDTDEGRAKRARGVVNARYLSYEKSGLTFAIGPADTEIKIEVEK